MGNDALDRVSTRRTFTKEEKVAFAIKKKEEALVAGIEIGSPKVREESARFRAKIAEDRRRLGLD
jgi:isopropylmalate/homocitrate/citramalate synthase